MIQASYGTTTETVLNGYDVNIVGQLPYMPWGKVVYNNYAWSGLALDTRENVIVRSAKF